MHWYFVLKLWLVVSWYSVSTKCSFFSSPHQYYSLTELPYFVLYTLFTLLPLIYNGINRYISNHIFVNNGYAMALYNYSDNKKKFKFL